MAALSCPSHVPFHRAQCSCCESSVAFKRIKITYTWELDATVTTFRRSSGLLDVKVSKLTAGGLDDADLV
jgi:hypothetical protein